MACKKEDEGQQRTCPVIARYKCSIEVSIRPDQKYISCTTRSSDNGRQTELSLPQCCNSAVSTTGDISPRRRVNEQLVHIKPVQRDIVANGRSSLSFKKLQLSNDVKTKCTLADKKPSIKFNGSSASCSSITQPPFASHVVYLNESTSQTTTNCRFPPIYHTCSSLPPVAIQIPPPDAVKQQINCVTWNIGKGGTKGRSTAGFAGVRRYLMSTFYSTQPSLFTCLQEIESYPSGVTNYFDQVGGKRLKEAGIGCPFSTGGCKIEEQIPPPRGGRCCYNNVSNCRFYGKIICVNDIHKFMLVSYHGKYYRMNEENRKAEILQFFQEMCNVADIHKMAVTIGGDFNLAIDKWKEVVEQTYHGRVFVAVKYERGPRRRGKDLIDTFAVVYPSPGIKHTICILGNPTPVSFQNHSPISTITSTISHPPLSTNTALQNVVPYNEQYIQDIAGTSDQGQFLFNLMDHDPVVITVSLYTK